MVHCSTQLSGLELNHAPNFNYEREGVRLNTVLLHVSDTRFSSCRYALYCGRYYKFKDISKSIIFAM